MGEGSVPAGAWRGPGTQGSRGAVLGPAFEGRPGCARPFPPSDKRVLPVAGDPAAMAVVISPCVPAWLPAWDGWVARWRLMRQARTSLMLRAVRSSRAVAVRVRASAGE